MSIDSRGRAWMEVDPSALRRNLRTVAASVGPGVGLVPMVKADGYGVGMMRAVRAFEGEAPWGYGVATVAEGLGVREGGIDRPVVVFSPIPPGQVAAALDGGLRLSVSDAATLARLADAARSGARPVFHLEIDTGMGRAGVDPRARPTWAPALGDALAAGARLEGVFTHLHSADEDTASVGVQVERFVRALADLDLPEGVVRHVLNSPGALRTPGFAEDLVRPGIFLYGGRVGADAPAPEPAVALRARVVRVHDARPGDTLGYGSTHVAAGPERWATVAIGYGDGLPRALSNRGWGLLGGRRVPIVGRISMDVTVVDCSGVPSVSPGDVVTFLGRDGDEDITVDDMAGVAGTISYEILTGITARVPRVDRVEETAFGR